MKIQNQPIFISGPHGGGKSTLLNKLSSSSNMFVENNFDIDFTIDFPSMSALSHFERSLIRLYHRFFIFHYAYSLAETHSDRFILTNRTVYDSEAYINVYRKLKWISEDEFFKLDFIIRNFNDQPCTIVLNPPVSVLKSRLIQRRNKATRINRDKIFEKEDSDIFLDNLHDYFEKFKRAKNVLYLEDNSDKDIANILLWLKNQPQ